ncbi:VOC family protein [Xylanimonas sp. McL0601]|uniref:VOC family protein n=1 Tax=Xylanimonas sp. McL0601 TaxID=3414739 RepID=UPI003CF58547
MPIALHLVVSDPERAAAWYADVLGAVEESRIPLPDGTPMSIQLRLGDTELALAGEVVGLTSPLTLGGNAGAFVVPVEDAAPVWSRALAAGATEFHPLADQVWGDRSGQFVDPFGHRWGVSQHLRDVPHEEVVAAVHAMYAIE